MLSESDAHSRAGKTAHRHTRSELSVESSFGKTLSAHEKRFFTGLRRLGPGLITGAADDDPSGIATYSQAGAQFGLNMLWAPLFTYPLMVAIQVICARLGRVTGKGLASNLLEVFPRPAVMTLVTLLFIANTANIGADLAAMGAAVQLVTGTGSLAFAVAVATLSLLLQVFVPYHRYVRFLKWLTLVLFAYVCVVFSVHLPWLELVTRTVAPHISWSAEWMTVVVAVFGTTISPYLFFWQSAEEIEDMQLKHRRELRRASKATAQREIARMTRDTLAGMGISNLIAYFIVLTAAVTLHQSGFSDIKTSADAARALRPIAGPWAFGFFTLGIVGTGLLAIPVLAGSTAYAVADMLGRPAGLEKTLTQAKLFYAVIAVSMIVALTVLVSPIDPIKMLFWSAVLNGVTAVPIMAATMVIASRRQQMGRYVASPWQLLFGWTATTVMAGATACMIALAL